MVLITYFNYKNNPVLQVIQTQNTEKISRNWTILFE